MTKTIINLTLALGLAFSFALAAPAKGEDYRWGSQTQELTSAMLTEMKERPFSIAAMPLFAPHAAVLAVAEFGMLPVVTIGAVPFNGKVSEDYETARSKAYNKCAEKRGLLTKRNRAFCIRVGHEAARRATRR